MDYQLKPAPDGDKPSRRRIVPPLPKPGERSPLPEGRTAPEVWSEEQYRSLLLHLHGQNPPSRFGHAFVTKEGDVKFAHNKARTTVLAAIASTWKSVTGGANRPYALVLLPDCRAQESTWAVWDFDFHEHPEDAWHGSMHRDLRVFSREAEKLREHGIFHLVEHSVHGWHAFLISKEPLPARRWREIRRAVESGTDFTNPSEFLPQFNGQGKGIRAPGSANPKSWHVTREDWRVNRIHWHNLPPAGFELNNKTTFPRFSSNGNTDSLEALPDGDTDCLAEKWRITESHTRHHHLLLMLAEGVCQFSKPRLREMAEQLHHEARPPCQTTMDEHLQDFEAAYTGAFQKYVLDQFNEGERQAFDSLGNQSERDVFMVIQNFSRLNHHRFHFSLKNVAGRVNLTWQRVWQIRQSFVARDFIGRLPGGYVPGVRALSFRWLLASPKTTETAVQRFKPSE